MSTHRPGAAVGQRLEAGPIEYLPYGDAADQGIEPDCEIVAQFSEVELEYAAIRRGAGLMDCPQRGLLRVAGDDRREFLNRMVTQELKDIAPGMVRQAFWLNRKGRVDADLSIVEIGDEMFIDLDIHQAAATVRSLGAFIISEDVELNDISSTMHHLAIHGRQAIDALTRATGDAGIGLDQGRCARVTVAGMPCIAWRGDETGEPGLHLALAVDAAPAVWDTLLAIDAVRPVGWYAYNVARIEAGTPLFNIDFGPTNLPHESGVLNSRVSFTKGCYLGQEIVARMQSLGRPKQVLIGLKMAGDQLPVAGAQVFELVDGGMGPEVGVVTSSTISPMLGATPIALAMIRTAASAPGTTLLVNAEGEQARATVHALRFLPGGGT